MDTVQILSWLLPWISLFLTLLKIWSSRDSEKWLYNKMISRLSSVARFEVSMQVARVARKLASFVNSIYRQPEVTQIDIQRLSAFEEVVDKFVSTYATKS